MRELKIRMIKFKALILLIVGLCSTGLATSPVFAVSIKIGMTTVLSGPSAALGKGMKVGINSFFQTINNQGGIRGQEIELIVYDDQYEPEYAASNMRKLIDDDEVLAVIGNVGTPTAIVTVPIAQEEKVLLFGAFSGGGVLRPNPASRYIINYRPSYAEEVAEMIKGLIVKGIKPEEIAFFTQRDSYGDAAFQGAVDALLHYGFDDVSSLTHGRYTRNTLNVENAVAKILDANITPKAVIMAGGYAPSAQFIKLLQEDLPDIWFLNLSFVGSHSLQKKLSGAHNVIVTQVVPDLLSGETIIDEYTVALQQFAPSVEASLVSLEGYIIAKIFYLGLLNIEGEINKESIVDGIELLRDLDIGLGLDIYYDKSEHQAIHKIWLTSLQKGAFVPSKWEMLLFKGMNGQ